MNADHATRALAALATPHALAVLEAMKDAEWHIASAAAARARVHVSTASKHLAALHEAGLVERKDVRTATGHAFAYRLPNPTITLTLDLRTPRSTEARGGASAEVELLIGVVEEADAVAGNACRADLIAALDATLPEAFAGSRPGDLERRVERLRSPLGAVSPDKVQTALQRIRSVLTSALGPSLSSRIFETAASTASERRPEVGR